jgi:MbtH protein
VLRIKGKSTPLRAPADREKMANSTSDDARVYVILKNNEEQYSLWLKGNEVPAGWQPVGMEGPKAECLQYVKEVWKDMTPLSLRRKDD